MAAIAFSAAISLLFLFISSPYVNGNFASVQDCDAVVLHLAGCMSYVVIGSTDDKPADSCCSGLKTVLDTDSKCLCEGLEKSDRMGLKLNFTKAITLPSLCKVNAPPTSACKSSVPTGGPSSGPGTASAPAPSSSRGASLIPISSLPFVIMSAMVVLFSHI